MHYKNADHDYALIDQFFLFFLNDTATTEIYTRKDTLSLHDALPISCRRVSGRWAFARQSQPESSGTDRSEEHTSELQSPFLTSYAVFCLKKKNQCRNLCRRLRGGTKLTRKVLVWGL